MKLLHTVLLVCVVVKTTLAQNDACSRSSYVSLGRDGSRTVRGTTYRAALPNDNNLRCDSGNETLIASNRGVWYYVEGNGQMLSVHSCEDESTYPVQVYVWEEHPAARQCDSREFVCVGESHGAGNCFSDPRQSCATIQTQRSTPNNFWLYRVFVTAVERDVTFDFALTFSYASRNTVCQETLAMDHRCDDDLNSNSRDLSGIQWFFREQSECISGVLGNGTAVPVPNSVVDCRGTDQDIEDFKKNCLNIRNHEVCDAKTPQSRVDQNGNTIKFQVKEGDCIPNTCVSDYRRRIQDAYDGTNSCTTAGLSGGEIAGIIVGSLAFCICCCGVAFFLKKRKRDSYGMSGPSYPGGGYNTMN